VSARDPSPSTTPAGDAEESVDAEFRVVEEPPPSAEISADAAIPEADERSSVSPEDEAEDRLFGLVAIGLMLLLLICVVLVLIADRRPPAGL
jgi:hypothetical protein